MISQEIFRRTPFGSLTATLTGINLFYDAVNVPDVVNFDSNVLSTGVGNAMGLSFITGPSSRRVGLTLKATFNLIQNENIKYFKNNILRSIAVLAVLFSLNSCETLELEILESPNALTPASSDIDFYLNAMQLNMASFFNGVKDEGMQLTRMSHLYGPFYENAYSTTQMRTME